MFLAVIQWLKALDACLRRHDIAKWGSCEVAMNFRLILLITALYFERMENVQVVESNIYVSGDAFPYG